MGFKIIVYIASLVICLCTVFGKAYRNKEELHKIRGYFKHRGFTIQFIVMCLILEVFVIIGVGLILMGCWPELKETFF